MEYRPGLNQSGPLLERLAAAMTAAERFDIAVAYAKASGVGHLLKIAPTQRGRAVVGLGFGITDPPAVEQLETAGIDVKVVTDSQELASGQFHPKLYLVKRPGELVAISGSANLTGGGWTTNVEQFEELTLVDPSAEADAQRARFETLWDYGTDLTTMRRSGDWDLYRQRARDRRRLEHQDRQRVVRLNADTGRLIGQLARRDTRRAPGWIGVTDHDWWGRQLTLRDQGDQAQYWTKVLTFKMLATGGFFFHLVKNETRKIPEDVRAIRGFSTYAGFDVGEPRELFRRYGVMLGVSRPEDLYSLMGVRPGRDIGVAHLDQLTELDRPVPLLELRAEGVSFERNIVRGRQLTLEEVAAVLELGGLGVRDLAAAAETPSTFEAGA